MTPFERLKNSATTGNLWVYVLALAKENNLQKSKVESLIFENFGFLPGRIMTQVVLRKLENNNYLRNKKFHGEKSYVITEKGEKELKKMREFYQKIIQKI